MKWKWCFRPWFCIVRLYWANEWDYVMNFAPGAGSIAIIIKTCWPAVQRAATVLWMPPHVGHGVVSLTLQTKCFATACNNERLQFASHVFNISHKTYCVETNGEAFLPFLYQLITTYHLITIHGHKQAKPGFPSSRTSAVCPSLRCEEKRNKQQSANYYTFNMWWRGNWCVVLTDKQIIHLHHDGLSTHICLCLLLLLQCFPGTQRPLCMFMLDHLVALYWSCVSANFCFLSLLYVIVQILQWLFFCILRCSFLSWFWTYEPCQRYILPSIHFSLF